MDLQGRECAAKMPVQGHCDTLLFQKAGDPNGPGMYRGITLSSFPSHAIYNGARSQSIQLNRASPEGKQILERNFALWIPSETDTGTTSEAQVVSWHCRLQKDLRSGASTDLTGRSRSARYQEILLLPSKLCIQRIKLWVRIRALMNCLHGALESGKDSLPAISLVWVAF